MNLEKEITARLQACATENRAFHDASYVNSSFQYLGCRIPGVRKTAKEIAGMIEHLPAREQKKHMHELWRSSLVFDVLHIPLFFFDAMRGETDIRDWKIVKQWSNKIDNWAHSDVLSGIYADLLERFPEEIYPTLQKWNTSKNPWHRRLSLTSLLYYANLRKLNPLKPQQILPLVKNLLKDEDVYVQKAVGWTLREAYNLYPKETKAFIKKHLVDLSSIAFSSATEKFSAKEKAPLKEKRKQHRKK